MRPCRTGQKQGLHYEEDSKRLGLLSKYDEEDGEALLRVGADGDVNAADLQAQLAADAAALSNGDAPPASAAFPTYESKFGKTSEYLTAEEVAAATGGKKRKRARVQKARKVRKRGADDDAERAADDEDGAVGGSHIFDELEDAMGSAAPSLHDNDRCSLPTNQTSAGYRQL